MCLHCMSYVTIIVGLKLLCTCDIIMRLYVNVEVGTMYNNI